MEGQKVYFTPRRGARECLMTVERVRMTANGAMEYQLRDNANKLWMELGDPLQVAWVPGSKVRKAT